MLEKQFKDPIYGYIEIDAAVVSEIIDTPAFQRLKDIRQTSYTPLYPAAYHNRYVHSLGVYHLGKIAFKSIRPQLEKMSAGTGLQENIDNLQKMFELACLLHDVGHAPFSHTGEMFYLDREYTLYEKLKSCISNTTFAEDFDALATKKPAEHECMSCIVGLKTFSERFHTEKDKDFFARCIIGMPIRLSDRAKRIYGKKKEIELLNCIISLLNSSIIDVDRLDYVIRDSTTIGFQNVQIDYSRLLKGLRIVSLNDQYHIGYHKSALSVIENAVYAHDAEKKWVQSHPAILYEMEILKSAMGELRTIFRTEADENPIFCYDALTESGKVISRSIPLFSQDSKVKAKDATVDGESLQKILNLDDFRNLGIHIDWEEGTLTQQYYISLLADEDLLHLMKKFCLDGFPLEYFARNKRRIAVWKSEAEFRALFQSRIGDATQSIMKLQTDFESLVKYCQDKISVPIVGPKILEMLEYEERDAKRALESNEIDEETYEDIIKGVTRKKHWSGILKDLAEKLNLEFDFLIVFQKKFNSSFKSDVGEIPIYFPNIDGENSVVTFRDVVEPLEPSIKRTSNFFHLFYRPKENAKINKKEIMNAIADKIIEGCIK